MKINMVGSFVRNFPFGTEIAFMRGLIQLGHSVGYWDPSRNAYNDWEPYPDVVISFKDHGDNPFEYIKEERDRGAITIEYQPDDLRAPGIRGMMERMRGCCDYAFTFDATGAKIAEELGYKRARKLIVTADPELYHPIPHMRKDIDFCFVGSMSNPEMHRSRNRMVDVLRDNGFHVEVFSIFDAQKINQIYNRSRVVLNHATDVGQDFGWGYGYQCRHFEAGFAGACLFSNCLLDDEGDGPGHFARFDGERSLIFWARELLEPIKGELPYENFAEGYLEEMRRCFMPHHRAAEIVQFVEEVRG